MIRAVIFDLYGTLVPSPPTAAYDAFVMATARTLGIEPEAFRRVYQRDSKARMTGKVGTHEQYLRSLAAQFGAEISEERLAELAVRRASTIASWLVPKADSFQTLTGLSARGLGLGLISDCSWETAAAWKSLPLARLIPDPVFSCVAGYHKPHRRLYEIACQKLGVPSSACVYVGDGGSNELHGALAAGMKAVQIGTDEEHDAARHRPGAVDWDGPRIGSLSDLLRSDLLK